MINGETKESFKHEFKGSQDFEYVKYIISKKIDCSLDELILFHKEKQLIHLFSICDVDLQDDTDIIYKFKN